jgi:hypothetical protein
MINWRVHYKYAGNAQSAVCFWAHHILHDSFLCEEGMVGGEQKLFDEYKDVGNHTTYLLVFVNALLPPSSLSPCAKKAIIQQLWYQQLQEMSQF